ncbi:hypothetical protein [Clostridium sulfidigenes]|nr:hypothetical protein [Clostridium sulfidigenes]
MDRIKRWFKKKFSKKYIKELLNKINFTKFTWVVVIAFIVGLSLIFYGNIEKFFTIKLIGIILMLVDLILGVIELFLYQLKFIIDDIDKMFLFISFGITYICLIIGYATLTDKIVSGFPEYREELTELFIYSFTGLVPAIITVIATYLAAIHGGKKAMEATEKQLDAQADKEKDRLKKSRSIAIRIIVKLLKEEIEDNVNYLKKAQLLEKKNIYKSNHEYAAIKRYLKFVDYDNVKYEIIKYCDEDIVEEVIDIYEIFRIFARHDNLNEIDGKEFKKITKLEQKYNSFLKTIESKESY